MKCTDADSIFREVQRQIEKELIVAVQVHGGDEYIFFETPEDLATDKDGPIVIADDGYSNKEQYWKVSKVAVVNTTELEIYGFPMEGEEYERQIGYLEARQLQLIIEAIPATEKVKNVTSKANRMKKLYHTNFSVAVSWCNNDIVLCNKLPEIDPSIWENFEPLVNLEYEPEYDEDGEEIKPKCEECGTELQQDGPNWICPNCGECEDPVEIYQWYITDCSQGDVRYLSEAFGLIFTYSDLLDCYVLCVTHYGTAWDHVDWVTTNPNAERKLGEKK